jgi:hypothetical protein
MHTPAHDGNLTVSMLDSQLELTLFAAQYFLSRAGYLDRNRCFD